jgi:hypothetical protein
MLRSEYTKMLISEKHPVKKVLGALSSDVTALLVVMRSEIGAAAFQKAITAIEGLSVRSFLPLIVS